MDGFYFHWVAWLTVILIYFFHPRTANFCIKLAIVFGTIILSSFYVTVFAVEWNAVWLLLTAVAFVQTEGISKRELIKACAASVMLGTVGSLFYIAAFVEPVWLLLDAKIMAAGASAPVFILLLRKFKTRFLSMTAGLIQGKLFTKSTLVFSDTGVNGVQITINSMFFLDIFALLFLTVLSWSLLEKLAAGLRSRAEKQKKPFIPEAYEKLNA